MSTHKIRPDLRTMVALDGNRVRLLREQAELTQLYVAKVVGVTTDTISRWENNRYPSIKRTNALKLAEALDVQLSQLLRETEPVPLEMATGAEVRSGPQKGRFLLVFLVSAVLLAGFFFFLSYRPAPVIRTVAGQRSLSPFAAPSGLFPVVVELEKSLSGKGIIVREHFPAGWKLIEAVPPASSLDNLEGMVRWIIKPGETRKRVVYLLRVGKQVDQGELAKFSGEVVFKGNDGGTPALIGGTSSTKVAPHIWADLNGDNVVEDSEMLSASDTVDLMAGVHLDWTLLEKIWDSGGYDWNPRTLQFEPKHP